MLRRQMFALSSRGGGGIERRKEETIDRREREDEELRAIDAIALESFSKREYMFPCAGSTRGYTLAS
jgi:hypothetical protein